MLGFGGKIDCNTFQSSRFNSHQLDLIKKQTFDLKTNTLNPVRYLNGISGFRNIDEIRSSKKNLPCPKYLLDLEDKYCIIFQRSTFSIIEQSLHWSVKLTR